MIGTSIGNSLIWDNGTNVGIGNTNTSYTLDVTGTGRFTGQFIGSGDNSIFNGGTANNFNTYALGIANTKNLIFVSTAAAQAAGRNWSGGIGANASEDIFLGAYNNLSFGAGTLATRMTILGSNGNVGIGTTGPSYQLQLSTDSAGKPNGGSWANSSDIRLKENVKTIDNALAKIMKLRGVTFDWKDETEQDNVKSSAGFIADEVMLAFPNWVKEVNASINQKELLNDDKVKSLSLPFEFDALLVEAIKELNERLNKAGL